MVSPLIEANSTSLGGWTSTLDGVDVTPGEVVSLRLADVSGVVFWSLELVSQDDETDLHGTAPALTVDLNTKTASFTAPVDPSDGWALTFRSTVGVMGPGKDANGADRTGANPTGLADYVSSFGVFALADSGLRVLAIDSTLEASSRWGYAGIINAVIRGLGTGTPGAPVGAAGGDLGATYPNPSVLRIHGASVPIAGALTIGNVLQVTGVSALGYAPVNLAGGINFVTGALPVANGGTGQTSFAAGVIHSNGSALSSSLIVNADVAAGAAIAVSKLAPGTNGDFLSTVAGVATWIAVSLSGLGGVPTTRTLTGTFPISIAGDHAAHDLSADRTFSLDAGGTANRVLLTVDGVTPSWGLIVNAQVDAAAAIAGTKISPAFGTQNVSTTGTLTAGATTLTALTISTFTAGVVQSNGGGVLSSGPVNISNVTGNLPIAQLAPGTNGQVLTTAAGVSTWATLGGDVTGTIPATVAGRINGATVPAAGALTTGHVLTVSGVATLTYAFILNANIATGAAIAVAKLAPGTDGQVLTTSSGIAVWATPTPGGTGSVPTTRVVNGTAPILINGGASADLSADITISVANATTGAVGVVRLTADLAGTGAAPVVARINGATVQAAGALTTGHVLQVNGVASLTYGFITDTNVASNAAIAVTKLANGTNGQVLTTVGTTPTWSTVTATTFGGVPSTRTLTGTAPVQIDGVNTPVDLSADRTISVLSATTGALGVVRLTADLGGTGASPSVLRIRDTAINTAGGALTPGFVLRVVSASAADWQQLTLADTTGTLPIARVAPGTNGDVLTTAGGVATWATIVNANVSASAAIAVSKLAAGADGQILTSVAGVPTWATGIPGGALPQSALQFYNVLDLAALTALSTAGFIGGEWAWVRAVRRAFWFELADAATPNGSTIVAASAASGNWYAN